MKAEVMAHTERGSSNEVVWMGMEVTVPIFNLQLMRRFLKGSQVSQKD